MRGIGLMDFFMEKVIFIGQIIALMKVLTNWEKNMDRENTHTLLKKYIKAIGIMVNKVEKAS
jgi:hypothetical protein